MSENRISQAKAKLKGYSVYLVVLLLLLLTVSLVKNILKISQAQDKVGRVKNRVEALRKENEELKEELGKIESETYVEFQARDKLGLTREGEIVVVLPDEEILRKIAPRFEEEAETLPDPTWKKWLKLFF